MFYNLRKAVFGSFNGFIIISSEATHIEFKKNKIKILTPKQMF